MSRDSVLFLLSFVLYIVVLQLQYDYIHYIKGRQREEDWALLTRGFRILFDVKMLEIRPGNPYYRWEWLELSVGYLADNHRSTTLYTEFIYLPIIKVYYGH